MPTDENKDQSAPDRGAEGIATLADDDPDLIGPTAMHAEAGAWVFIAAFIGLAIAWSTGAIPPWAGALIGGSAVFVPMVFWNAVHGEA